jgi:hypothetical protein
MLRTIQSYLCDQVWPRRYSFFHAEFWLAFVGALALALFASSWGLANTKVGEALTAVLAYAAVAFGFCLAGLTVALTLPSESFSRTLASKTPPDHMIEKSGRIPNAYSDLLFVFSWTAVAHWGVIFFGFVELVACGYGGALVSDPFTIGSRLRLAVLGFLVLYAVFQFLITLITLSQVGNTYVDHLRTPKGDKVPRAGR